MIQTITPNQLILHLYSESSPDEVRELNSQILLDEEVSTELESLYGIKKALDQVNFEPSANVVNNILAYSLTTRR